MSKLGNTNKSFKDYLQDPQYEKFFMKPMTSFEVCDVIKDLDESKSPDPYNIPVKLLKLIPYNMSVALADIFNESFKTGIFHVSNKLAHVTLIHKGYSILAVTNYRPISVLPILSKGPVKLIQRVKIAHSFLRSVSNLFHFIILSLHM